MRSIVVREFGAPEVMRVENVPDPTPSASQVLVRVRAVGVNPVDTYIRSGVYAAKPPLPAGTFAAASPGGNPSFVIRFTVRIR